MDWEDIKNHWNRLKGKIKEEFGELTDNDMMEIEGKREVMIAKLRSRYGIDQEEAERRVAAMPAYTLDDDDDDDEHKQRRHGRKHHDDDDGKKAHKKDVSGTSQAIQGEGNYEAAERFQREQHEFARKQSSEDAGTGNTSDPDSEDLPRDKNTPVSDNTGSTALSSPPGPTDSPSDNPAPSTEEADRMKEEHKEQTENYIKR